jgi:hypothetical protein
MPVRLPRVLGANSVRLFGGVFTRFQRRSTSNLWLTVGPALSGDRIVGLAMTIGRHGLCWTRCLPSTRKDQPDADPAVRRPSV